MTSFFKKIRKNNKGFTLIELLVTIVIFVLLTSIVLFSQNSFNNSILLNNLAYDISLTIKQAQTYGVSVREASSTSATPFPSYGVYFNIDKSSAQYLTPSDFIIFAYPKIGPLPFFNGSNNCPSDDSQCVQKYSIRNGSYISSLCAGSENNCLNTSQLIILFQRPKPDAFIYTDNNSSIQAGNYAKITISSATGATTSVVITSIGQIYVKK